MFSIERKNGVEWLLKIKLGDFQARGKTCIFLALARYEQRCAALAALLARFRCGLNDQHFMRSKNTLYEAKMSSTHFSKCLNNRLRVTTNLSLDGFTYITLLSYSAK